MERRYDNSGARETRRDFIKKTATTAAALSGGSLLPPAVYGQDRPAGVVLVTDDADGLLKQAPVQWAIGQLENRLESQNISVGRHTSLEGAPPHAVPILVASGTSKHARSVLDAAGLSLLGVPEATGLVRGNVADRSLLLATGSDVRGLVYALLELGDRVEYAPDPLAELQRQDRIVEQPTNPIRSIARLFTSETEDKAWYYDKSFWERYLSMLATQRINRFTLTFGLGYNAPRRIRDSYFYFTYPFLLSVPGYDVKAVGLSDEERDRNLEMLRFCPGPAILHTPIG